MVKKIQIKDVNGKVIFEYEKENNTIKDTLEEGVRRGVSFNCADLRGADLSCANLSGANLHGANLSKANLRWTILYKANLSYSSLYKANLSASNLRCAIISMSHIREADLRGADLSCADIRKANLRKADLLNAELSGANLYNAYLNEAKNVPYIPMACPSEGAFIGWKKLKNYLVKLEITEDAKRSSATTNKCRCDKTKVLSITDLDGRNPIDEIVNDRYKPSVTYKVGEMVYPDSFDENRWNECSHGIHFFAEKVEAINY